MDTTARLRDKAASLPQCPGVYLMKDAGGNVLYVGKSKKLKNRVSSYFIQHDHNRKTALLVSKIHDFDYILCKTEIEALTLENVLIKKHTPKYNIRLKDAKSYPYIKITAEAYPRLLVTRERHSDKARYFGPYTGVATAYTAMDTVKRIFSLPTCKRVFPRDIGKERPCIYRDMGRCLAPCTGKVSPEEYGAAIRHAAAILDGDTAATKRRLEQAMLQAAQREAFEEAATLRDSIRAIEKLSEKQKVVDDERVDRDVFAVYTDELQSVLGLLVIRHGALVQKSEMPLSMHPEGGEDAVALIADYYERAAEIPRQVILDFMPAEEDLALLAEYLTLLGGHKVEVRVPERGRGRALCQMAKENAKEAARQAVLEGAREDKDLRRLCTLLSLAELPRRIEAYDISNFGNEAITASMVVYAEGRLKKSDYRSFTITTTEGADDYGSMREALRRRLSHIGDASASLGERPELILLDGGAGQVHAVKAVMEELGLEIPLFGMVKDDFHKTRAITDGEQEISIAKDRGVYAFVYKLQEEAHRFAYKHTAKKKSRSLTHSSLEQIPGIGPAKAKRLLAAMTLSELRRATAAELAALPGISQGDGRRIAEHFRQKSKAGKEQRPARQVRKPRKETK